MTDAVVSAVMLKSNGADSETAVEMEIPLKPEEDFTVDKNREPIFGKNFPLDRKLDRVSILYGLTKHFN